LTDDERAVRAKLGEQDGRRDEPLGEAQARVRKWVKRAIAELPAASLNRLAATCAMYLDLEARKRTGKSPDYAKSVVDELAAERVARVSGRGTSHDEGKMDVSGPKHR
jgi:hypothetical protein